MTTTRPYQRRVVCAACRDSTGQIILGPRHFDRTMHETIRKLTSYSLPWEQGFIDQCGVFMNRQEAWQVASAAGQIVHRCGGDYLNGGTLYSENLY